MEPQLKPYMASADEPSEGAILVFAHNIKEAKKTAWQSYSFLHEACDNEYINMRGSWMKDCDYMFEQADQEKLKNGEPHIIETPIGCKGCEMWGLELDGRGYCESCAVQTIKDILK